MFRLLRTLTICLCCASPLATSACAQPGASAPVDCTNKIGTSREIEVGAKRPSVLEQLSRGEVVLSFDDGPAGRRTRDVLDVLDQHCTRATFFLQGDRTRRKPKQAAKIEARGHAVGSHSYDHANLAELDLASAITNLERGHEAVNQSLSAPTPLFRYPFLAESPELDGVLAKQGLTAIGVDADGQDWTGNSPDDRVALILAALESKDRKGVILLHDPFPQSAETVELLLTELHTQGYQIVALRGARQN